MSNEMDDALEDRLEKVQRRAENFREFLRSGEEVTIGFFDNHVTVEESYRSQLERKHPRLFGRLLSIEAQLDSGWLVYFLGLAFAGVFLFGLQLSWWEPWLGASVCGLLNDWWFFVLCPAAMVYLATVACGQWRRRVFRRNRPELLRLIVDEALDRDLLLVMLRDVAELEGIAGELKLDREPLASV